MHAVGSRRGVLHGLLAVALAVPSRAQFPDSMQPEMADQAGNPTLARTPHHDFCFEHRAAGGTADDVGGGVPEGAAAASVPAIDRKWLTG